MEVDIMAHEITINTAYFWSIIVTIVMFITFPEVSVQLWQIQQKRWKIYRDSVLERRSMQSEDKARQYCEVDLTKLK